MIEKLPPEETVSRDEHVIYLTEDSTHDLVSGMILKELSKYTFRLIIDSNITNLLCQFLASGSPI